MKLLVLTAIVSLATATAFSSRQTRRRPTVDLAESHAQRPIFDLPGPAMPPSTNNPDSHTQSPAGTVVLSDVMGRDRAINIFAGSVRDVESVSRRLDDEQQNSTVLAPLNSAMDKMPRKAWEDPQEYDTLGSEAYEGSEGRDRAQRNIRRFVEAHVVPVHPWKEGERVKPVGGDSEIWWEEKDGTKIIQPGDIKVDSIGSSVHNGQVWLLKSVRDYSS
ncbi:FAS1 domain-containing protein [Coniella lustricola]|uniref:FAS1 domain-containing protein n=1 Tax=Coniella lustricola TaxID=2025994 RepID=A0A2T3AA11_9PEZI|nr:FAS1 domain-containing protein [Coniella lustricola]